ncbi:MAG TPA: hypothetical protein VIP08_15200 [Phenylobacterium sp.]|uniref:hypothetical protein n=1 Tax=Phenylobacterium sp. TaxID=1871053 RepID=UPI002F92DFB1
MLTASETAALRNLAEKKAGTLTAFVNIADARRLTELGLAQRSQQGWDITPEGAAYLASIGAEEGYAGLRLATPPRPEVSISESRADEEVGEDDSANADD